MFTLIFLYYQLHLLIVRVEGERERGGERKGEREGERERERNSLYDE